MADAYVVSFTVKDIAGNTLFNAVDERVTANSEAASDIFRENYKEALNGYRFYGNLRTQISWPPATILGAGISFSTDAIASSNSGEKILIFLCYGMVLTVIWIMVYHMQRRQAECMAVAKDAQKKLVNIAKGNSEESQTYGQIFKGLSGDNRPSRVPDGSTIAFLVFCLILGGFVSFAVFHAEIQPTTSLSIAVEGQPTDEKAQPSVQLSGVKIDCGLDKQPIETGPFTPAHDAEVDYRYRVHEASEVAIDVSHIIKDAQFVALILIGSVDKLEPRKALLDKYGSNQGLAQARAQTAKTQLLSEFGNIQIPQPQAVITLNTGPTQIGSKVKADGLAKDRVVRVCAVYEPKS